MPGHRPFSALRAAIEADPTRAARLARAERQIASEQAAHDQAIAEVPRASEEEPPAEPEHIDLKQTS